MNDEAETQPALTPEEWELVADALEERRAAADQAADHGSESGVDAIHRLESAIDGIRAGQPFGFTWKDVDALRKAECTGYPDYDAVNARVESLADRIAALLPPRNQT